MTRCCTAICVLFLLAASGAEAVSVGGIELPQQRDELTLQGAGLLRKGFVFNIYVGALYLARETDAANVLSSVPKRLDIHYFHNTPKKHMVRVAEETLRKNFPAERWARHKDNIAILHNAYRDGKKGGCASLIYRPKAGLTYGMDGATVVTIKDDAFANDYFRGWLDEKPSSATIKKGLLSKLEDGS